MKTDIQSPPRTRAFSELGWPKQCDYAERDAKLLAPDYRLKRILGYLSNADPNGVAKDLLNLADDCRRLAEKLTTMADAIKDDPTVLLEEPE